MKKYAYILSFFAVLLLLNACSKAAYYEQSISLPENGWAYDDLKQFEIEITDNEKFFDLILDISHSPSFGFENLYVKVLTIFPTGEEIEDKVSLQLADELDQWEGKCNAVECTVSILLQNKIYFKDKGKHLISFEQYNREDPLPGINSLTLKVIELDI